MPTFTRQNPPVEPALSLFTSKRSGETCRIAGPFEPPVVVKDGTSKTVTDEPAYVRVDDEGKLFLVRPTTLRRSYERL